MFQRSGGISQTASLPSTSSFQNDSESFAPPGNRQPMPIMAIPSLCIQLEFSRELAREGDFRYAHSIVWQRVINRDDGPKRENLAKLDGGIESRSEIGFQGFV